MPNPERAGLLLTPTRPPTPKICVSLALPTPDACVAALEGLDFAEIRLDALSSADPEIARIFAGKARLIATCRPGRIDEETRQGWLMQALAAGAAFVDLEVESPDSFRQPVMELARRRGAQVIVSYHNYEGTPLREELARILDSCFAAGADIAKIACYAHDARDSARLLGLLDDDRPMVVIGMGVAGMTTRLVAPLFGSAFTFVALTKGNETAPGQMTRDDVLSLYGQLERCF